MSPQDESMKQHNVLKIILLVLMASPMLSAQINDGEKFISILKGQQFIDTIEGNFPLPSIIVQNCSALSTNIGGKKRKITISPPQSNPNYLGPAKAYVQYVDGNKPRWITWNLNFVDSKISTKDDFVFFNNTDPIVIQPLTNDISTSSNLTIVGLSNIQGGIATTANNSVTFVPDTDSEKGYALYSVKDSLGAIANGVIHFTKEEYTFPVIDTLHYSLLNTRSQNIILPDDGFNALVNPSKGVLASLHQRVFQYQPNKGSTGTDVFSFSDANNNTRVIIIKLINKQQNTSSIRDDKFYTSKNTPITFNVFANDLSSNFPIVNFSPNVGLVHDTLGVFIYTPNAGFSGIKNFTYTVNYGLYQATGKITVYIGNYEPKSSESYTFKTLKNQSLVLNYDMPVDGYIFNLLNQPQFGTVEVFENTTVGEGCNTFLSKSTIIYSPDNNYYGSDSFDIEYCILNNPCVVYKVYIDIINSVPDTLCHCKGPDCVWAGDMNGDGRVSVSDILSLGRFAGLNGAARSDISYPFVSGQSSDNWSYLQPNGLNIKHVDANGDGLLSTADTLAISENFGKIHSFVPEEVLAIKDYPFTLIPNSTELDSGDVMIIDVVIGSGTNPVVDLFGLSFGLNIAPGMIDSSSLSVNFDKSGWFTNNSASLQMVKQPKDGVIHAAFTRTASIVEDELEGLKPIGVSGDGLIGKIIFIVEDELEGLKTNNKFITRRISTKGIEMEGADGEKYVIPDSYVDVKINLDKTVPVPVEEKLIVYPNPAKDNVLLHFNGRNQIKGYKIFNQQGLNVSYANDIDTQSTTINTTAFAQGMYIIQILTSQGTISKKIMILDKK